MVILLVDWVLLAEQLYQALHVAHNCAMQLKRKEFSLIPMQCSKGVGDFGMLTTRSIQNRIHSSAEDSIIWPIAQTLSLSEAPLALL